MRHVFSRGFQLSRGTLLHTMGRDMSKHDKPATMCHNTTLHTLPSRDAQQLIISGSNYLSVLSCYFSSRVDYDI